MKIEISTETKAKATKAWSRIAKFGAAIVGVVAIIFGVFFFKRISKPKSVATPVDNAPSTTQAVESGKEAMTSNVDLKTAQHGAPKPTPDNKRMEDLIDEYHRL